MSRHVDSAPKQFNWSKVSSGKIQGGLKSSKFSSRSWGDLSKKTNDLSLSSGSDDSDGWGSVQGSRQRELISTAKRVQKSQLQPSSSKVKDDQDNKFFEGREWLKSARQRELIRTGSGPSIQPSRVSSSSLHNQWRSTAKNRFCGIPGSGFSVASSDSSKRDAHSGGSVGKSDCGSDLLVDAVRHIRTRHIKLLIDGGSNPDALDIDGET